MRLGRAADDARRVDVLDAEHGRRRPPRARAPTRRWPSRRRRRARSPVGEGAKRVRIIAVPAYRAARQIRGRVAARGPRTVARRRATRRARCRPARRASRSAVGRSYLYEHSVWIDSPSAKRNLRPDDGDLLPAQAHEVHLDAAAHGLVEGVVRERVDVEVARRARGSCASSTLRLNAAVTPCASL